MAKLGVGVVGCGGNGRRHVELYASMDEVDLIGVCDLDAGVATEIAGRYGTKAFTRVEDLVAEPGVQAVNIVNSGSHRDPTVIAAGAGKHVLIEVPFAVTLEECDEMIGAADRAGVRMMYAQTHRYVPSNVKVKELIDRGDIGDVVWLTFTRMGQGDPDNHRWSRQKATGGGFFTWEGPHIIDQLRWLAGSDIETVNAVGMGRYASGGDGEDAGIGGLSFKSGAFGAIIEGNSNPGARYMDWRIVGTEGMIDVVDGRVRLGKGDWETVPYPHMDDPPLDGFTEKLNNPSSYHAFRTEFLEFIASIREDREPDATGQDGRAALEGGLALRRSHETGAPVKLPLR